jgi:hypothetical protein
MLEVDPEVALKIQARARERGVPIDVYLRQLLEKEAGASEKRNVLSSQERVRLLREWASGHSTNTPLLSDDALSRESIYRERG